MITFVSVISENPGQCTVYERIWIMCEDKLHERICSLYLALLSIREEIPFLIKCHS
jgi:hypothetical protein